MLHAINDNASTLRARLGASVPSRTLLIRG